MGTLWPGSEGYLKLEEPIDSKVVFCTDERKIDMPGSKHNLLLLNLASLKREGMQRESTILDCLTVTYLRPQRGEYFRVNTFLSVFASFSVLKLSINMFLQVCLSF